MNGLSEGAQLVVRKLLYGRGPDHEAALVELPGLPEKQQVAGFLATCLEQEEHAGTRAWIVSGLAAINDPCGVDAVKSHLRADKEKEVWVRYWAAIGLARMRPAGFEESLTQAIKDPEPLIKAVAMRLLVENQIDKGCVRQLLGMINDSDWETRWSACKVLRREAGHRQFEERVERQFIPDLEKRLHDDSEVTDVRFQAALALGNMAHETGPAIDALSQALKAELPDWARRGCVDALGQIRQPATKDALLGALQDQDAEIRVRAANGLEGALTKPGAVAFVVDELLRRPDPPDCFFDALRLIDNTSAANVLAEKLLHPDMTIANRASAALTKLGGEAAVRTLQAQRTKALDTYTQLLGNADRQVMVQFNALMQQAQRAFLMSMTMHGAIFCIGVGALVASLWIALSKGMGTFERYVGVGTAVGSLATLLLLFYRDPLRNIGNSVTSLMQVNVVFLGYVRQINQIDATFKQMFLSSGGFGIDQMKQTVEEIQESVKRTLAEVKTYLVVKTLPK